LGNVGRHGNGVFRRREPAGALLRALKRDRQRRGDLVSIRINAVNLIAQCDGSIIELPADAGLKRTERRQAPRSEPFRNLAAEIVSPGQKASQVDLIAVQLLKVQLLVVRIVRLAVGIAVGILNLRRRRTG
jgi:hypothetical protein